MKEHDTKQNLVNAEVYILMDEEVTPFLPLLPEDNCKADPGAGFVILGAIGTDPEGVSHACGAMVLKIVREDMLLLRWLLVSPKYQCQGIGSKMMIYAQEIAKEMGMQIVGNFSQKPKEGKEGMIYRFLRQRDFVIYPEKARSYTVTLDEIGKEDFFKKEIKKINYITLEEASSHMIIDLNHELSEKGLLFIGPISKENILSDISLMIEKQGEVQSCIIFRSIGESELELAFLYTDSKASVQMPILLIQAYQILKEKYPLETTVVIPCVTEASTRLVETLLPLAKKDRVAYSVQWLPEKILE